MIIILPYIVQHLTFINVSHPLPHNISSEADRADITFAHK